ncbi:MAG: hypothetical protein ACXVCH_07530 [Bdellovibrionota bacterium]
MKLAVALDDPKTTSAARPPTDDVEVLNNIDRPNSRQWRKEMDCLTIAHETLHHLGLVDEYLENGRSITDPFARSKPRDGNAHLYDCRLVPAVDSLMKGQFETQASQYFTLITCRCNADEHLDQCKKNLDEFQPTATAVRNGTITNIAQRTCPDLSDEAVQTILLIDTQVDKDNEPGSAKKTLELVETSRQGYRGESGSFRYLLDEKVLDQPAALLLPGHFRTILGAGSDKQDYNYIVCSANAYRTTYGEGCMKDLPDACSSGKDDWLTR